MLQLNQLCDYLNQFLKVYDFKDYGPNGLQVEGTLRVGKIGVAVSASKKAIVSAVEAGCDVLIVHHGLFWYQQSATIVGAMKEKLDLLLKNNLSLIAYHLPLDAHPEVGNNWGAFREMGMKELGFFGKSNLGVIGCLSQPLTPVAFQKQLEQYYGSSARVALGGGSQIQKVALISGAAESEIVQAISVQADAFITGRGDEPSWHLAFENQIHFYAMGHFATEKIGPRLLGEHLSQQFSVPCHFCVEENPF